MQTRYIAIAVFIFVIFQLSLIPLENAAISSQAQSDLRLLSNFGIVHESQAFGFIDYVRAPGNYFTSLYNVVTSDTPVFGGAFEYIRWLVMAPILVGIVFTLILLFYSLIMRLIT